MCATERFQGFGPVPGGYAHLAFHFFHEIGHGVSRKRAVGDPLRGSSSIIFVRVLAPRLSLTGHDEHAQVCCSRELGIPMQSKCTYVHEKANHLAASGAIRKRNEARSNARIANGVRVYDRSR